MNFVEAIHDPLGGHVLGDRPRKAPALAARGLVAGRTTDTDSVEILLPYESVRKYGVPLVIALAEGFQ